LTLLAIVADASPLIALNDLGLLDRCAPLFASWLVPPAVAREIAPTVRRPPWIAVRSPAAPIDRRILSANLGRGETEAIALAVELGGHQVLVDERSGRRLAASLGLPVIGTVGLLVVAKRHGVLPTVRPSLETLRATGFFLADDVIRVVLRSAGEDET
jgi:predicted nucleic acid-binding protein